MQTGTWSLCEWTSLDGDYITDIFYDFSQKRDSGGASGTDDMSRQMVMGYFTGVRRRRH